MENTLYKEKESSNFSILHLFFAIVILFWMNDGSIGFLNGVLGFRYMKIAALFMWLILSMSRDPKFIGNFLKFSFPIILSLLLIYVEKLFGVEKHMDYADGRITNSTYILIITALFTFYFTNATTKEKRVLLYAWFIDIIICGIVTIIELQENPLLSRLLATADPTEYIGKGMLPIGVLSFGHAYAFVFISLVLCIYLKKEYSSHRFIALAALLFLLFLIIEMQFAISFFLVLLALITFFYLNSRAKGNKTLLWILLFFLLLAFWFSSGYVIDFLIGILDDNSDLVTKLGEVKAFLAGDEMKGTDLSSRFKEYSDSFNSIFSNYFMGALLIGNGEIGGHSELLDYLATLGFLPFICLIWYFKNIYNEMKKRLSGLCLSVFKTEFFLFFLLSIINTSLWSSIMIVFLLVVPLLLLNAENKNPERIVVKEEA